MDLELSPLDPPVANYVSTVRTGNLLYVAGYVPRMADNSILTREKSDGRLLKSRATPPDRTCSTAYPPSRRLSTTWTK